MNRSTLAHLRPNEQAAVSIYLSRIQERFADRILAALLFGSKARGDDDAESDLDLLVLVDGESDSFRATLWQMASDVSLAYDVTLSPRVFGRARWDETRRMRLPLYRAIIADAIPLTVKPIPA